MLLGYKPGSPRDWYLGDGSSDCVKKHRVFMCAKDEEFIKVVHVKAPDTSIMQVYMNLRLDECNGVLQELLLQGLCDGGSQTWRWIYDMAWEFNGNQNAYRRRTRFVCACGCR